MTIMSPLIESYIKALLIVEKKKNNFSFDKFKALPSVEQKIHYAQESLGIVGEGSSRAAFILNSKKVLKVALNQKGLAQNKKENEVYQKARYKQIFSAVYQADPGGSYLISELVRPLQSEDEFEQLSGIPFEIFSFIMGKIDKFVRSITTLGKLRSFLNAAIKAKVIKKGSRNENLSSLEYIEELRSNPLLIGCILAIKQFNLVPADFTSVGHFGKTTSGNLVLLDYGYDEQIWLTLYKPERDKEELENQKTAVDVAAPTQQQPNYTAQV